MAYHLASQQDTYVTLSTELCGVTLTIPIFQRSAVTASGSRGSSHKKGRHAFAARATATRVQLKRHASPVSEADLCLKRFLCGDVVLSVACAFKLGLRLVLRCKPPNMTRTAKHD